MSTRWQQQKPKQLTTDVTTGQPCWSCQKLRRTYRPKRTWSKLCRAKHRNYSMCAHFIKEHCDFRDFKFDIALSEADLYLVTHVQQIVLYRAQDEQHAHEVSRFQEELAEANSQLQILQKQLDEEMAKQPLTNQEVRLLNCSLTEGFCKLRPLFIIYWQSEAMVIHL